MSTDGSLLTRFLAGAEKHLVEIGEWVGSLQSTSDLNELVKRLGRGLHTLKGEARLLGVGEIEQLSHACEDVLFSHHKAGRISEQTQLVLLEGLDAMFFTIQALNAGHQAPADNVEEVLAHLRAEVLAGAEDADAAPATKSAAPKATEALASSPEATPTHAAGDTTEASTEATHTGGAGLRSVYMSIEQLDKLTNLTGSISGALVRNRQYLDQLFQVATELRDAFAKTDGRADTALMEQIVTGVESLTETMRSFREHHFRLDLNYTELSESVRAARIQPLSTVFSQYPSSARRLARTLGKRVSVQIVGAELGVDQRVLEQIAEPCVHLLRNALAHGIETPAERRAQGKPEVGTLTVRARHDGELVRIDFIDDGHGIDVDRVARRAVSLNLIDEDTLEHMSARDRLDLIFASGLSTADTTTELAGRGVGLDAVASVVGAMGGTVTVNSIPGQGTHFTLIVPVSLSLTRALLVESCGQLLAVPNSAVVEVARILVKDILTVEGREMWKFRDKLLPLVRLREALGLPGIKDIFVNRLGLVVLRAGDEMGAFVVDRFVGERDIVTRPFGDYIERAFMTSGVTTIEDGSVVVILHVPELLQAAGRSSRVAGARPVETAGATVDKRVLWVDDSVITREYAGNVLRGRGFEVSEAADGVEALEVLRHERFDLVMTDLQMPRMDGFELVAAVRKDPQLRNLPVIVMSTLDTPEAKRLALDAGADAYLVKANFGADSLMATINQVIR